jgi:catechol 2,3-dioxygenase-like lactoylglutathione lyase family enzyme
MTDLSSRQDIEIALDLPAIDQIGFVVPDIEQAMADYAALFGPWQRMDAEVNQADFRGETRDCEIKMAFGKTGELEIELIEVVSGVSPHTEFLDSGRSGMHHIRYPVDDLEKAIEKAAAIGWYPIWSKNFEQGISFSYLEKPGDPLLIEFIHYSAG